MEVLRKGAQRLGLHLEQSHVALFQRYHRELLEWNRKVNLTAIVEPQEVQSKHFLDSLTVSLAIPRDVLENGSLVDVGSGAGFPGLPLKFLWPGLRVALVESVGKKAAFLRHVVETLELAGVKVYSARAETLAHDPRLRGTFDVAVSRAVAEMAALAELTLPFCKVGGIAVAQKKVGVDEEIRRSERAVATLGGELESVEEVDVAEMGEHRLLVVIRKVAPSPEGYPRRPGIPVKRPL
ncbi:MAG: 16S rRNA (guanine(527)-N(7))-methyltransferase RsmG [Chloroflexi bacterium]|nr:16S rRNA (guanine(527)-N(7))-methyltransferase RsmG [Chloroflexota bacterium]